MISPEDIKQQALKWWMPFLQSQLTDTSFFPKRIDRIGKVKPGQITRQFETLQNEIASLYKSSKDVTGFGYQIKTAGRSFRRTGSHELPDSIEFETVEDYIQFTGKGKEWKLFLSNCRTLLSELPQLKAWLPDNVLLLTEHGRDWQGIIEVCRYFVQNPRPGLYVRQLPVKVHSKFIEENSSILQSMLDFLLTTDHIRNAEQKRLAERYFLKHDEPLIRIRLLDENILFYQNIHDVSIRLSDFEATDWNCTNVVITENKMNFLSLPDLPAGIALWSGGGFKISYLRNADWLKNKRVYYWGDIDEHGFQILHQLRSYFPHTQSIMMDQPTYDQFKQYAVPGKNNPAEQLNHLNHEEAALYASLKKQPGQNRLEQEKIPHYYSDLRLKTLIT